MKRQIWQGTHSRKPDLQELPGATDCLVLLPGKALALHTGHEIGQKTNGRQTCCCPKEEQGSGCVAVHIATSSTSKTQGIEVRGEDGSKRQDVSQAGRPRYIHGAQDTQILRSAKQHPQRPSGAHQGTGFTSVLTLLSQWTLKQKFELYFPY